MRMRNGNRRGQVLAGVVMILLVLLILVPALVQWVQTDAKASVKNSNSTIAFNLAQAAVERGAWKVKSSTGIWQSVTAGTPLAGYNFDITYNDVPGGTYRIEVYDIGTTSVTIVGEGRDALNHETRSIKAIYKNQTLYSPLMATGGVTMAGGMLPMWGPIMSAGAINISNDLVGNEYYPRKYSQQAVYGTVNNPRETNWPNPPFTDNVEWWGDYQYVPELPIIDFTTLRSSAAATHTLNVYGCVASSSYTVVGESATVAGHAPWDGRGSCTNTQGSHSIHFSASYNHPYGTLHDSVNSYVWYWDNDVVLGGDTAVNNPPGNATYGVGLRGDVIVRGNLTLDANGDYNYTGSVPVNAWAEYDKLTKTTYDTAATDEYAADNGYHTTLTSWRFGTDTSPFPGMVAGSFFNTVGIRGFTYVGGNLTITSNGFMDFNGAVWVNGSVVATSASIYSFCGIYYDDTLTVPTLNVVLIRQSWNEVSPSTVTWSTTLE